MGHTNLCWESPRHDLAYRIEDGSTIVVVQVWVDVVNTNGVDTQHLHDGGVTKAGVLFGQRVHSIVRRVASAAARLVCDANDLVSVTSRIVDEVAALDLDGGNSSGQRGSAEKAQDASSKL